MVFSSHFFLFYFLPFALAIYYLSPRPWRLSALTLASYVFYGWTNPWFILLILWTTVVDFCCGNLIYGLWNFPGSGKSETGSPPDWQRKTFLTLSLLSNLGMLCFFKYFMFAQENVNALLAMFGRSGFQILEVALPAGISFYTFESISYNIDIYHGRAKPAGAWRPVTPEGSLSCWKRLQHEFRSLSAFACYITQFPHLVAGPIIRYQDMERQLHERTHSIEKFARGIFFFALGISKKVLIANTTGEIADTAFRAETLPWQDAWYGLFAYAFQIYFDFSGYSDMAIGLGLMFGFEFPKNFDSPYKASSITEFWRRWHISLSSWLRDYLYFPLGGNRYGSLRTYRNLMLVMLLGGLWHGASWTFVVWGAIHGGYLAFERMLGKRSAIAKLPRLFQIFFTFLIVNIAWVFFRSSDLTSAIHYFSSLFAVTRSLPGAVLLPRVILYSPDHMLAMAAAAVIAFFGIQTWDLSRKLTPLRAGYALGLLGWSLVALSSQSFNPFLYFQF